LSFSNNTIFCSPQLQFFEKDGLTVFQNSHDFDPPEQRSKKYTHQQHLLFYQVKKFASKSAKNESCILLKRVLIQF
jgi:hypothetical protein